MLLLPGPRTADGDTKGFIERPGRATPPRTEGPRPTDKAGLRASASRALIPHGQQLPAPGLEGVSEKKGVRLPRASGGATV